MNISALNIIEKVFIANAIKLLKICENFQEIEYHKDKYLIFLNKFNIKNI